MEFASVFESVLEPELLTSSIILEHAGNIFDGKGFVKVAGGHTYKGSFKNGKMHGKGELEWSDGTKYTGQFIDNQITGRGTYNWKNGSVYTGDVVKGLRHGFGSFLSPTGMKYEGDWKEGIRDGWGILWYNNEKTVVYEGEFKNGERNGKGRMTYENGDVYEGNWENGQRHGYGRMKWLSVGQCYTGDWACDMQNGHGEHTWQLSNLGNYPFFYSNRYVGSFVDGKRHGMGVFFYVDGSKYSGEWRENKKHGEGVFLSATGVETKGVFANDRMVSSTDKEGASSAVAVDAEGKPRSDVRQQQKGGKGNTSSSSSSSSSSSVNEAQSFGDIDDLLLNYTSPPVAVGQPRLMIANGDGSNSGETEKQQAPAPLSAQQIKGSLAMVLTKYGQEIKQLYLWLAANKEFLDPSLIRVAVATPSALLSGGPSSVSSTIGLLSSPSTPTATFRPSTFDRLSCTTTSCSQTKVHLSLTAVSPRLSCDSALLSASYRSNGEHSHPHILSATSPLPPTQAQLMQQQQQHNMSSQLAPFVLKAPSPSAPTTPPVLSVAPTLSALWLWMSITGIAAAPVLLPSTAANQEKNRNGNEKNDSSANNAMSPQSSAASSLTGLNPSKASGPTKDGLVEYSSMLQMGSPAKRLSPLVSVSSAPFSSFSLTRSQSPDFKARDPNMPAQSPSPSISPSFSPHSSPGGSSSSPMTEQMKLLQAPPPHPLTLEQLTRIVSPIFLGHTSFTTQTYDPPFLCPPLLPAPFSSSSSSSSASSSSSSSLNQPDPVFLFHPSLSFLPRHFLSILVHLAHHLYPHPFTPLHSRLHRLITEIIIPFLARAPPRLDSNHRIIGFDYTLPSIASINNGDASSSSSSLIAGSATTSVSTLPRGNAKQATRLPKYGSADTNTNTAGISSSTSPASLTPQPLSQPSSSSASSTMRKMQPLSPLHYLPPFEPDASKQPVLFLPPHLLSFIQTRVRPLFRLFACADLALPESTAEYEEQEALARKMEKEIAEIERDSFYRRLSDLNKALEEERSMKKKQAEEDGAAEGGMKNDAINGLGMGQLSMISEEGEGCTQEIGKEANSNAITTITAEELFKTWNIIRDDPPSALKIYKLKKQIRAIFPLHSKSARRDSMNTHLEQKIEDNSDETKEEENADKSNVAATSEEGQRDREREGVASCADPSNGNSRSNSCTLSENANIPSRCTLNARLFLHLLRRARLFDSRLTPAIAALCTQTSIYTAEEVAAAEESVRKAEKETMGLFTAKFTELRRGRRMRSRVPSAKGVSHHSRSDSISSRVSLSQRQPTPPNTTSRSRSNSTVSVADTRFPVPLHPEEVADFAWAEILKPKEVSIPTNRFPSPADFHLSGNNSLTRPSSPTSARSVQMQPKSHPPSASASSAVPTPLSAHQTQLTGKEPQANLSSNQLPPSSSTTLSPAESSRPDEANQEPEYNFPISLSSLSSLLDREMLFPEFIQAIVRCAAVKYDDRFVKPTPPPPPPPEPAPPQAPQPTPEEIAAQEEAAKAAAKSTGKSSSNQKGTSKPGSPPKKGAPLQPSPEEIAAKEAAEREAAEKEAAEKRMKEQEEKAKREAVPVLGEPLRLAVRVERFVDTLLGSVFGENLLKKKARRIKIIQKRLKLSGGEGEGLTETDEWVCGEYANEVSGLLALDSEREVENKSEMTDEELEEFEEKEEIDKQLHMILEDGEKEDWLEGPAVFHQPSFAISSRRRELLKEREATLRQLRKEIEESGIEQMAELDQLGMSGDEGGIGFDDGDMIEGESDWEDDEVSDEDDEYDEYGYY